uniref:Gigaxonin n=1 Tax=Apteryx owenii TaxID=8824 RepID=A0A8B9PF84_APTOW
MSGQSAVSDPQHPARLLRALSSFREESRFCDAHLVLEGEEIPVQKNILAAASPYIRLRQPFLLWFGNWKRRAEGAALVPALEAVVLRLGRSLRVSLVISTSSFGRANPSLNKSLRRRAERGKEMPFPGREGRSKNLSKFGTVLLKWNLLENHS